MGLRVFYKKDVKNAKSCAPIAGITMFGTPIFRERIGHFLTLKLHTHFAIAFQKDLSAQAHNHPQPSA